MGKWHGSCSSDEAIEHALPQRGVRMESSVYQRARQEWDERYADLVLGKRNWQIADAAYAPASARIVFG